LGWPFLFIAGVGLEHGRVHEHCRSSAEQRIALAFFFISPYISLV
jgi:hypothetical protein